jgi:hypothetical protein
MASSDYGKWLGGSGFGRRMNDDAHAFNPPTKRSAQCGGLKSVLGFGHLLRGPPTLRHCFFVPSPKTVRSRCRRTFLRWQRAWAAVAYCADQFDGQVHDILRCGSARRMKQRFGRLTMLPVTRYPQDELRLPCNAVMTKPHDWRQLTPVSERPHLAGGPRPLRAGGRSLAGDRAPLRGEHVTPRSGRRAARCGPRAARRGCLAAPCGDAAASR